MKKLILIVCCMLIANMAISQEPIIKPNGASEAVKKDPRNVYDIDNISTSDILDALELLDVKISKIKIPRADKERSFGMVIDEYSKSELIRSDTTWLGRNTYHYW